MARLQGHFVRYRASALEAVTHAEELKQASEESKAEITASAEESVELEKLQREQALRRAKRGPLTAADVDRMVFNPQPGWDDNIR